MTERLLEKVSFAAIFGILLLSCFLLVSIPVLYYVLFMCAWF